MQRKAFGSVIYYQFHSLLPFEDVAHGAFTRVGGLSRRPWSSLNTGHTVGDDLDAVAYNQDLICQALGFATDDIVSPHQVHGAETACVTRRDRGRVIDAVDGLITNELGVLLMLRFADCTPVWFYDPIRRAIGLVHAGWRGTVAGIVRETVAKMRSVFGSRPSDLVVGIGPAIGPCCYEVGPDVARAVARYFPANVPWVLDPRSADRWHLDLWLANELQLEQAGVQHIQVAEICTACNTDEWFSHRAEQGRTGRFGALIGMKG
jgi:YfiH family protein